MSAGVNVLWAPSRCCRLSWVDCDVCCYDTHVCVPANAVIVDVVAATCACTSTSCTCVLDTISNDH